MVLYGSVFFFIFSYTYTEIPTFVLRNDIKKVSSIFTLGLTAVYIRRLQIICPGRNTPKISYCIIYVINKFYEDVCVLHDRYKRAHNIDGTCQLC